MSHYFLIGILLRYMELCANIEHVHRVHVKCSDKGRQTPAPLLHSQCALWRNVLLEFNDGTVAIQFFVQAIKV